MKTAGLKNIQPMWEELGRSPGDRKAPPDGSRLALAGQEGPMGKSLAKVEEIDL